MRTISADQLKQFEPAPGFLQRAREMPQNSVTIAVGDRSVRVIFERVEWAVLFAAKFADQVVLASDCSVLHYVMRDASRYVFWSPDISAWCWDEGSLPNDAVVFLADSTAVSALLTVAEELISFHAAVVGIGSIAAAIAGDSNAGKTTTAVACGRAGLKVYSDERCVVRGSVVVPFARSLHIREDGWALLQSTEIKGAPLPAGALRTREGFTIPLSAMFGRNETVPEPQLRAVFILSGTSTRATLERVEWPDVAPTLARGMSSAESGLRRGVRLLDALRNAACFRLRLGTPDESALLIQSILGTLAQ